jgi:hypothetical protein
MGEMLSENDHVHALQWTLGLLRLVGSIIGFPREKPEI